MWVKYKKEGFNTDQCFRTKLRGTDITVYSVEGEALTLCFKDKGTAEDEYNRMFDKIKEGKNFFEFVGWCENG